MDLSSLVDVLCPVATILLNTFSSPKRAIGGDEIGASDLGSHALSPLFVRARVCLWKRIKAQCMQSATFGHIPHIKQYSTFNIWFQAGGTMQAIL